MWESDLTVEVDRYGIAVADPRTGERITFKKEGSLLIAYDLLLERLGPCSPSFLAKAWRAAYAEARKMGWLRS